MKKQNRFIEFLNSKGFYTALFTCLFAVLAIAAFVSIKNIDAITKLNSAKPAADPTYGEQEALPIDNEPAAVDIQTEYPTEELAAGKDVLNKTRAETPGSTKDAPIDSKAAPNDSKAAPNDSKETPTSTTKAPSSTEQKTPIKVEQKTEQKAETSPENTAAKPTERLDSQPKEADKNTAEQQKSQTLEPDAAEQKNEGEQSAPKATESSTKSTAFADDDKMNWPLDGAIVMNYSVDHAIYDKTLDQYRTNPTVSIGAEVGTQVKAAADGVVKSIRVDPRSGYLVVLDHGGGWETRYGQLQETVLVKEGQQVTASQAIGGVGSPTKYGVLLGSHLEFGISKDNIPQNPQLVLAK